MKDLAQCALKAAIGLGAALGILLAASSAHAFPETDLMISEIFFDPVGPDDRRQWVELAKAGNVRNRLLLCVFFSNFGQPCRMTVGLQINPERPI